MTPERAREVVDRSSDQLFDFGSKSVLLTDQKKEWASGAPPAVMTFSLVAKAGFIALPVAGTVTVDESNVTVECELPALAKNFIGEDKVAASVEKRLAGMLSTPPTP
jgi:hypothetical protein